jgi:hypothetical protein
MRRVCSRQSRTELAGITTIVLGSIVAERNALRKEWAGIAADYRASVGARVATKRKEFTMSKMGKRRCLYEIAAATAPHNGR